RCDHDSNWGVTEHDALLSGNAFPGVAHRQSGLVTRSEYPRSVNDSQRPRDVDAPLAVVRVGPGLAEIVCRLEDALSDQPRVAVAELRHEQRREPGDVRRREARAAALRAGSAASLNGTVTSSAPLRKA